MRRLVALSALLLLLAAGGAEAQEPEAIYILAGRCRVSDGKESVEVGPDQLAYFPAGFPHELTSLGPDPLRMLVILAPPLHR